LNDAFGSMDFEAGVKAREQWGRLLPTANLSSEDRLFDHAQPALDWLAEEERLQRENVEFESAVRDLELAIDNDEGSSKVEQTLYAMRKFPHDIPKKLDIRCQRYLATKQAASRRRIIFIAATTALCIFLVAGMAIWIALMSRHQQALAAAETRITKLVQGEFYEDAVEFYETLDASLRDSTVVNEQKLIAERELDSRQDQLDAFSSAFGDIATDLKPPSDLSEYSADELKGLRAQLVGLQRRLRDTESLVSTPAHQTQFSKLRAEFSERENAIQTAFDLLFQEKLNSYASRITQYKSAKDEASLKQVVAELAALEQANPDASHGLTQQIKPVIRDVESYLTKAQANLSEREKLSDITQSVGDINQFSSTLKRYAASYPTSPVSRSLDRLLTEQKLWSSVKTWSDFYKSPVFSGEGAFLNITPSGASSLVSKGDKLVASLDQMPLANSYLQRKPYLESVGARNPAGQADLVSKISVELNSPLLSEKLQIVTKKSGARFYCSSDNIRRSGNQRVVVYYAPDDDGGISTKRVGFFETELEGVRPAPQAALALKLKGSVQKLQTGNADWEEEFGNMLVAVLEAKDVDDVHRIILLDILAQAGLKGSSLLFDEIYPLTEKALTFATLCRDKPWYDSTNEEIPALRGRASQILNAIPPLQSNLKSALSQRAKLATPISSNYKWVGWLNSVGGDWVGEVKDANTDGALFVIYLASASGEPRLDVVGQVAAGKAVIDASRDESLFVGRPLFVMPKNVANNASNGAE
jgi:CHASE3 domain sensor protein